MSVARRTERVWKAYS